MYGPRRLIDGRLEGVSGNIIVPNPSWLNPSGDYYVGAKKAYELYPKLLLERVKQSRVNLFEV